MNKRKAKQLELKTARVSKILTSKKIKYLNNTEVYRDLNEIDTILHEMLKAFDSENKLQYIIVPNKENIYVRK